LNKRGYGDDCKFNVISYGNNKPISDTCFIFVYCGLGLDDNGDFSYLYYATMDSLGWKMEKVMEISHDNFRLGFGIDLDGNGIMEYIDTVQEFDACMGSMFTKLNGKWIEKYIEGI
jgi:hypothetical protein